MGDRFHMARQHVARIRIVIGALALAAILAQLLVVRQVASGYAERYPEVAYLELPYVVAVLVAIGGFEVTLLAAWLLLSDQGAEGRLSGRSKEYINVMAASLCFAALVLAGICLHAGSVENIGGPAVLCGLIVCTAFIAVVVASRSKAFDFLALG